MLEKANEYIRQNYIDEKEKPLFHVTPETGWMTRMVSLYTREKYICSISSIHIKQNGDRCTGGIR